jgi:hypothetical protein
MKAAKARSMGLLIALAVRLGFAQASLPSAYTGPWQGTEPPDGWTFSMLGNDIHPDYDGRNDGAAKFQNTGQSISIQYDAPAGALSYWIRGLTFSGGVFRVEQSVDGLDWVPLQTYTQLPSTATFETRAPSLAARYLRFIYTMKEPGTGNVGLDGISIVPFVQPVIGTITATGGVARVSILQSVAGRSYVLERTPVVTSVPVEWTPADSKTGTGGTLLLQDASPTNVVRYYRVRDTTP